MKKSTLALITIFLVIVVDQITKIWIKTNMYLGQEYRVFGHWFYIHFTENNGMAFGLEFAGNYGKLFLSLFRIVAVIAIGYYIWHLSKKQSPSGVIIGFSLMFAGALGNIIDSVFYGVIFSDSYYQIATLFPTGGGYAGLLHGKVVDMLYFPIISGHFPSWMPLVGTQEFIFFRPVFNIADSSITCGVLLLLLFHRKFFKN